MSSIEQTLSIIKPDAVERNLTEDIKEKFLTNSLKIIKSNLPIKIKIKWESNLFICIVI